MIDGKVYWFNTDGLLENGWQTIQDFGHSYLTYFGQEGDNSGLSVGEMAKGYIKIDGKEYYFAKPGDRYEGKFSTGWINKYINGTVVGKMYFG